MDPIAAVGELKIAQKRIGDLERSLDAAQSRLTQALSRVDALERALRSTWARQGTVQGRR